MDSGRREQRWHSKLEQAQIADTILDRIVHNSYKTLVDGEF